MISFPERILSVSYTQHETYSAHMDGFRFSYHVSARTKLSVFFFLFCFVLFCFCFVFWFFWFLFCFVLFCFVLFVFVKARFVVNQEYVVSGGI